MATAWNDRTLAQMLAIDPSLRGLASRLARDAQEAEDLVQDTWIAALTEWPGEPCALEPWTKQVLRNVARKRARRVPPQEWSEELAPHGTHGGVDSSLHELARGERAERLRALVEALPEPYRSTLFQRFYAERSVGEIAEAKGVPRATVSTQLRRALERLRMQLSRQRDLLPLLFPWSRLARRAPSHGTRAGSGLRFAIGAAAIVAVLPFTLALASWSGEDGVQGAAVVPFETDARADVASVGRVPIERRELEPARPVGDTLLVEARAESNGAPLAGRRLSVWDESGAVRAGELDANGRARIADFGTAHLVVVEVEPVGGGPGFRAFARAENGEVVVRAGSGPSVRFTLSGAGNLHPSELRFGVRSSRPGSLVSPLLRVGPGSTPDEFLAQLPESSASLTGYESVDLYAATSDGLRAAEAPLDEVALAKRRVLELTLESRASLEIELAPERRESLATSVVRIVPEGSASAWVADPSVSGRALVGGLRPGKYHVEVEVSGREPWSSEIELAPGASERLIALAPPALDAPRAPLRGRILRERSGYDGAILVALEGGRVPQFTQARWIEVDGRFEARFELPQGSADANIVRPIALDGLARFEPPSATITPGNAELSFECRGSRPQTSIALELHAADTLAPLERCTFEFELPGGTHVEYRLLESTTPGIARWAVSTQGFRWKVRDGSPFDWIDEAADVRWRLAAPGFETLDGDRSAWATGTFSVLLRRTPTER